jgi:hypothetical protein
MKTRGAVIGLLIGAAVAGGDLSACGDKFLVPSRVSRYERAPMPRSPAAILIYANPTSRQVAAAGSAMEPVLRKVGYEPSTVDTPGEFASALRRREWDLVILGLADYQAAVAALDVEHAPAVVPLVYEPTRTAWGEAKKQSALALKVPVKSEGLLDAVDRALSERASRRARQRRTAGG